MGYIRRLGSNTEQDLSYQEIGTHVCRLVKAHRSPLSEECGPHFYNRVEQGWRENDNMPKSGSNGWDSNSDVMG